MKFITIDDKKYCIIDDIMIAHSDVTNLNYNDAVLYCSFLRNNFDNWQLLSEFQYKKIINYLKPYYDNSYVWLQSNIIDDTALAGFSVNIDNNMRGYINIKLIVIPVRKYDGNY